VDWLLLAGLGIMWLAFLMPTGRRRHGKPSTSVEDFERRMELLAQVEAHGTPGRWIVTPRKGARFVGVVERKKARARERRRQVLAFLLESIGLTFLIGLVPPLRVAWALTGVMSGLLVVYVWALLTIKQHASHPHETARAARPPEPAMRARQVATAAPRYVAEGRTAWARPTFNGLGSIAEGDRVHVIVRPADQPAHA
jgi:hypothetical protein